MFRKLTRAYHEQTTTKCVLHHLFLHFQQNRRKTWLSIRRYAASFVTSCSKTPLHNFKTNRTECWWSACLNLSMLCEKLHAKEFSFHLIQLQGMQNYPIMIMQSIISRTKRTDNRKGSQPWDVKRILKVMGMLICMTEGQVHVSTVTKSAQTLHLNMRLDRYLSKT